MVRYTSTYAVIRVSCTTLREIELILLSAGYGQAIHCTKDETLIDMDGLMLQHNVPENSSDCKCEE